MTVGIRGKLLLIMGTIVFLVLSTLTYLQITLQRTAFEGELQKQTSLLKENLYQRAHSQAETLERLVAEDIASYNLFALMNKIQLAVKDSDDLEYVVILDSQNKIYVHTAEPEKQQSVYVSKNRGQSNTTIKYDGLTVMLIGEPDAETFMEYQLSINIGESSWGKMLLGYSLTRLNDQITRSQQENESLLGKLTIEASFIAVIIMLITYVLISQLSQRIVAPIIALSGFAKELSSGDFSHTHIITSKANDEVGMLTRNFSNMALKLEEGYRRQAKYNQTLEEKVNKRTEELNHKNDELMLALKELEERQQQLVHAEKMAALGQLIAGIAHEINTPLGAIKASVGNTSKYLSMFSDDLPDFLASASKKEQLLLCTLLAKAQHEKVMSTREERKIKRQMVAVLNEHQLDKSDELADMLVDMGLSEDLPQLPSLLIYPSSFKIVGLAHKLTGIGRNSATVRTAIGRASKVVFALKNFAHHDNTGQMISSDINQGLQTVLVLYQSLLKQGCEVIEHFGELPMINCYPDELNQVWTNLIHNALYAMENSGSLTIETALQGENIKVTITDSGSGIPEDIQSKIYDSFFTTKPAGEGSGLGLGICQRIIEKHNGSIDFTSEPGKTTFEVILPATR